MPITAKQIKRIQVTIEPWVYISGTILRIEVNINGHTFHDQQPFNEDDTMSRFELYMQAAAERIKHAFQQLSLCDQ